ncbi:MAG: tetratricopeptide repeat protein [Prevotellaceae bacterium]|nr:tetratricopeptide repeat protein [Prevotellaceae bacterium]
MDLEQLIKHPELMDKETLYDLRSLLALYPYFQTARLLLLQNLYLLHDPSFDEELRRSAVYITDRKVAFNLVEAAHYKLRTMAKENKNVEEKAETKENGSRTISLIEQFLDSIPADKAEEENKEKKKKRKPTPADAAVDYVSYLLETEEEDDEQEALNSPIMKGQDLIDNFINNDSGRISLQENPVYVPDLEENDKKDTEESYFTETLAQIYIKQGRYSKALEIIKRLNLNYPKKNAYFADQIRFLEKLIINNKYK